MNRIVIMGRLTKDPDLKSTGSGVSVCNTTIAVDRNFTENGKREADFFPIVAWRHNADFLNKYFTKGRWIYVDGHMQSRKWQDKQGNDRITWEVIADEIGFCGDRKQAMPEDDTEDEPPRRRAADFGGDDNGVPF